MKLWSFSLFDFCTCYYVCTILVFIQPHLSCSKLFFITFINNCFKLQYVLKTAPQKWNIMKIYFLHLISSVFDSKLQFCCFLFLEYATGLFIHLFCFFLCWKYPPKKWPYTPILLNLFSEKKGCSFAKGEVPNFLDKTATCWFWKLLQLSCSIMQLYENNWSTFNLQTQQMIRQNRWWFWQSWQLVIFYSANIILKQFQNF